MIKYLLLLIIIFPVFTFATPYMEAQKLKNVERAEYWEKKGYIFDSEYMTAYSMDQKVKDIKRAKYWKQKGYNFDSEYMTEYSMDQKVKDIKRAKYWKRKGYNFDAEFMTAYSMDQEAKKGKTKNNTTMVSKPLEAAKVKPKENHNKVIKKVIVNNLTVQSKQLKNLLNVVSITPKQTTLANNKKPRKSIPTNSVSVQGREYTCSELSRSEAYSLLSSGHTYLDRDGDGHPCEWGKVEGTYRSNCHYVNGYYRKSGTYVSGYTRCR